MRSPRSPRYVPSDDTRLLGEALSPLSGEACLEIGFGSGALISGRAGSFELAVGTDIIGLEEAKLARSPGVDLVLADRASCFRDESFDLVFFNPPYLPSQRTEDAAVDGGPTGTEVPTAFLVDGLRVLREGGTVLFLLSDAGDIDWFLQRCRSMGLEVETVSERRTFYEKLVVFRTEKRPVKAKAGP